MTSWKLLKKCERLWLVLYLGKILILPYFKYFINLKTLLKNCEHSNVCVFFHEFFYGGGGKLLNIVIYTLNKYILNRNKTQKLLFIQIL